LYLVLNGRPVCPMYFIGQLMHLIWYTPFFPYLSVCVYGFNMFCMVFFVLNAIFICVSLNSCVSFLVCFPWYVKVAHFSFNCCISVFSFCFCGVWRALFSVLLSYLLFLNMLCVMDISFFFACFVIG
jgi:hypothetical protein